jgi:metallo-beta-lactamase family protein
MRLTFWGAARQVTGSMHLLEINDYKILIDCGLDVGREREADKGKDEDNYSGALFPFDPSTLSVVLLTHAHIDHSGLLPNLLREGFEGQIFCTAPTQDLTEILLYDSANLATKKAKALSKRRGNDPLAAAAYAQLYFQEHVSEAMERFVRVPLDKAIPLTTGVRVTFITAGHLLGAASLFLEIEENGKTKRIGFSGDLGRFNYPLLADPKPFPEVDYLICESTYGNRTHKATGDPIDIMEDVIKRACVDMPGRLIIPAFSIGRTQALLYTLNRLYTERGFAPIKVFSDSPMALQSTKVFTRYNQFLNEQSRTFQSRSGGLFDFANFEYVADPEKSREINNYSEPCIVISSSGMIKGGRIEYHIRRNIENPYATILIVGFAPEGTLSHSLLTGVDMIKNDGKDYKVLAKVERTDIFSGHADMHGLMAYVKQQLTTVLRGIFLVHGDWEAMQGFANTLGSEGYENVFTPAKGDSYEL